jgi:hypothetical protein
MTSSPPRARGSCAALGIDADDPATWAGKAAVLFDRPSAL